MTTLYTVLLSKSVRGAVKGPVKALRAIYAGHYRECEKDIMRPDMNAVRECLPACYRKAWDRNIMTAWFPSTGDGPAYVTLRGSRGQYLNTVYLQPFDA